jgi:hypothetical protein
MDEIKLIKQAVKDLVDNSFLFGAGAGVFATGLTTMLYLLFGENPQPHNFLFVSCLGLLFMIIAISLIRRTEHKLGKSLLQGR